MIPAWTDLTVADLLFEGEKLKEKLWFFMEHKKHEHLGVKESMNELLDLIDELED